MDHVKNIIQTAIYSEIDHEPPDIRQLEKSRLESNIEINNKGQTG
jgi:hypothetical protein